MSLQVIADDFKIRGNTYLGRVLAGAQALYCICADGVTLKPEDAQTLADESQSETHPCLLPFSALPQAIREDPACAGIRGDQQVCLLPRASSPRLSANLLTGVTLETSAGVWRLGMMPTPTWEARKALLERGWEVGESDSRATYLCLIVVGLFSGFALAASHALAIPLGLAAAALWKSGDARKLYWTMLFMGLAMAMVCYSDLADMEFNPDPVAVSLASLESGTAALPGKARISGPIDCLEGLGLVEKGMKGASIGCVFPVVSEKHPYYNRMGKQPPPTTPNAFPVYLYWYGPVHNSGHEIVQGIVCEPLPPSMRPEVLAKNNVKPRIILYVSGYELDPPPRALGVSGTHRAHAQNFYIACFLITIGLSMSLGSLLRPQQPAPPNDQE